LSIGINFFFSESDDCDGVISAADGGSAATLSIAVIEDATFVILQAVIYPD
jgi:hypothetical protein